VAELELAGPAVAGAVLADPVLGGLGVTAGVLDGLGPDGLGLAGGVDGPRVAPGGLDGLGVDGLGRGDRLAHAPELRPVTPAAARLGPPVTAGRDGLALGLGEDALVGLGLTVGDGLLGSGLAGGGLVELWLALGDGLAGPRLLAALGPGAATAGGDETQLAADCL
jgi:hypothetical protein